MLQWCLQHAHSAFTLRTIVLCNVTTTVIIGARDRNRTGTPAMNEAADFKSAVSTNFTTRAPMILYMRN